MVDQKNIMWALFYVMRFTLYHHIQVLQVVVKNLPLKEDYEENPTVFTCIRKLYQDNAELVCIS